MLPGEMIPRTRLLLHGFATVVGLLLTLIVTIGTLRAYHAAIRDATGVAEAAAQSAATLTARLLIGIDALMVGTAADLRDAELDDPVNLQAISTLLGKANDRSLAVRSLALATIVGEPRISEGTRINPELRRAMGELAARFALPGTDTIVIGTPERSRLTGRWRVYIGRLIEMSQQRAILAAEVQIEEFGDSFALLGGTRGSRIALLREDGTLIASDPHREDLIARKLFERPDLAFLRGLSANGTQSDVSGLDGESQQILAWRRVLGRPLLVLAWIDRQQALAAWEADLSMAIIIVVVSLSLIAAFVIALSRAMERQSRIAAELKASETAMAEKSALLEATFGQMSEGLSVFDKETRLMIWNQRYMTMLDLPDHFCYQGLMFADIIRYQLQRGEFGAVDVETELERRISRVASAPFLIEERESRTGRILQINRRPLPNGGFMILFTDVSERRRFEQELARAKDEADRAARAKTEFIQRLSHALRTPLTSVIGYAELLQAESPCVVRPDGSFSPSAIVLVGSRQVARLLQDVIEFSEYELGERRLIPQSLDLGRRLIDLVRRGRAEVQVLGISIGDPQITGNLVARADSHAAALVLDSALALVVRHARPQTAIALSGTRTAAGIAVRIDAIHNKQLVRALMPSPDLANDLISNLMERQGGSAAVRIVPGIGAEVQLVFAPAAALEP